jgi:hypothetical protein
MAALIAGTQKISLVGRVEKAELEKAGLITRGRMLVDLGESVELATGGLVTTERAVTIDRARTKKVLRALWKGAIYLKTETAGMVQVMEKRLPHATRETQLRDIEGAREDLSVDGTIPLAATTRELAVRGELIGLAPDKLPPPDKVYDFSLMREIVAELEATNWKPTP